MSIFFSFAALTDAFLYVFVRSCVFSIGFEPALNRFFLKTVRATVNRVDDEPPQFAQPGGVFLIGTKIRLTADNFFLKFSVSFGVRQS